MRSRAGVVVQLLCHRTFVSPFGSATVEWRAFVDPGWCPLPWFNPRAGLKSLCARAGACAALLHVIFSLIHITRFHLTVAVFCVFFARTGRPGRELDDSSARDRGFDPARARDDDDDDDDAARPPARPRARARARMRMCACIQGAAIVRIGRGHVH